MKICWFGQLFAFLLYIFNDSYTGCEHSHNRSFLSGNGCCKSKSWRRHNLNQFESTLFGKNWLFLQPIIKKSAHNGQISKIIAYLFSCYPLLWAADIEESNNASRRQ